MWKRAIDWLTAVAASGTHPTTMTWDYPRCGTLHPYCPALKGLCTERQSPHTPSAGSALNPPLSPLWPDAMADSASGVLWGFGRFAGKNPWKCFAQVCPLCKRQAALVFSIWPSHSKLRSLPPVPRCDPNQTGRPGRGTGTGRSTSTHPPPTGPIGPTGRWGTPAGASADHKLGGSWREVILQQPDLGLGLAEATWCPGHRRPSPWDRGAGATGTRCLPHGLTHNEARTCS